MIYAHFLFAVLRVVCFALSTSLVSGDEQTDEPPVIDPSGLAAATSLLLSFDVIIAVSIYVVPKVLVAQRAPQSRARLSERESVDIPNSLALKSSTDACDDAKIHSQESSNRLADKTAEESSQGLAFSFRSTTIGDPHRVRFGMDRKAHGGPDDDRDSAFQTDEKSSSFLSEGDDDYSYRRTAPAAMGHNATITADVIQEDVNES